MIEPTIKKLLQAIGNLPGQEAQYLMAPPVRKLYADTASYKATAKQSAVCVALHLNINNEWCVYLMQRTNQGVHGHQISFPGGKVDAEDVTYLHTALREFNEEVGSITEHVVIGMLTPLYIPPSNFYVEPYLVVVQAPIVLNISSDEVEKLYSVPLHSLFNNANVSTTQSTLPNGEVLQTPCFKITELVIWGATAMILSELKQWYITNNLM